ncbi:aminotransferase [Hortaea werneckii]|nr:aminotransferase [Hortaea werneckii]
MVTWPFSRPLLLIGESIPLLQHPLEPIQPCLERIHPRAITNPHEVMARAIKQIPSPAGIQIEKDARHHNHLLLQARLEEVQPVVDPFRQLLEIQPEVESTIGHIGQLEPHARQPLHHIIPLVAEMPLQAAHLIADLRRLEHRDRGFLERHIGPTVQVRAAGPEGFDEGLGPEDPRDAPSRQPETLRQPVDDEDVVLVDVLDVFCRADDNSSITNVARSRQRSWIRASSGLATILPVGLRGLLVKMTDVPRRISSEILSGLIWYWSSRLSGIGTAANPG